MMDAQIVMHAAMQLDDGSLGKIIGHLLRAKPHLAPGVVNVACPDLTYAPARAINERRSKGIITQRGTIECPPLRDIFGCDVLVDKRQLAQLGQPRPGMRVSFAVFLTLESLPQAFDLHLLEAPASMSGSACCCAGGMNRAGIGLNGMGNGAIGSTGCSMQGGTGGICNASACGGSSGDSILPCSGVGNGGLSGGCGMGCGMGGSCTGGYGGGMIGTVGIGGSDLLGPYEGIVKSYNSDKGFAFISCPKLNSEGHEGDVYIHPKFCVNTRFNVGDIVKFNAFLVQGRLQGRDVLSTSSEDGSALKRQRLDTDPMMGLAKGDGQGVGKSSEVVLGTYVGTIKSHDDSKGFCFIHCPELNSQGHAGDVYVYKKNCQDSPYKVGDSVGFTAYLHSGRLQGKDLISPSVARCAPHFEGARTY